MTTTKTTPSFTPVRHYPGHFYYAQLNTSDVDGACAFYGEMLGWQFDEIPGAPNRYLLGRIGNRSKGAIGGMPSEPGPFGDTPAWLPFMWVDDVDATVARATELGGTLTVEAVDVFDAGRMAILVDPTGASFGIWQDTSPGETSVKDEHGSPFWYELHTSDVDAALEFYRELVGWTSDPREMAPGMTYHLIVPEQVDDFQTGAGGIMGQTQADRDAAAPSRWFAYFNVDDTDAAFARALEHGATSVMEPHDIPGVGRSCWVADPQGAQIAMMRPDPRQG